MLPEKTVTDRALASANHPEPDERHLRVGGIARTRTVAVEVMISTGANGTISIIEVTGTEMITRGTIATGIAPEIQTVTRTTIQDDGETMASARNA